MSDTDMKKENGKSVLMTVAVAFVSIFLYHTVGTLITKFVSDEFLRTFLAELFFAALILAAVLLLKQKDLFHSDPALFKSGWKSAGLLLFIIAAYGILGLVELLNVTITPLQWALLTAQILLVGFAEEVLFRGLIQRAFHRFFGEDSRANVFKAVVCSGIVFGLAHLVNVDRGNPVLATVLQAGVNCFAGMYYCAVFFRTGKNIKYLIILHALYDYVGMVVNGRLRGESLNTVLNVGHGALTVQSVAMGILLWGGVYLLSTIFILRPSKIDPLLTNTEEQNQS